MNRWMTVTSFTTLCLALVACEADPPAEQLTEPPTMAEPTRTQELDAPPATTRAASQPPAEPLPVEGDTLRRDTILP